MAMWIDLIDDTLLYLSDPSPHLHKACFFLSINNYSRSDSPKERPAD